jgi:hypothetical protein
LFRTGKVVKLEQTASGPIRYVRASAAVLFIKGILTVSMQAPWQL